MSTQVGRVRDPILGRSIQGSRIDFLFFILGGIAATWFTVLLLSRSFALNAQLLFLIPFWAIAAYLTLPRLHRILTKIYVPDYFLGRSRTSEGLLGDPVNLAFDGTAAQIHEAMTRAGWTLADDVTLRSSWRIVLCSVLRRSYPRAPISPLYLFDRKQDLAYQQEVEDNPAQRHHVRFWRCPDEWPLPGGHRVTWLAAGSFDTAVGLSFFTMQVTHRIDEDIDIERDHIIATLREADPSISVEWLRDFSTSYHHRNGGGDKVRTDGHLPVVDLQGIEATCGDINEPQVHRASRGFSSATGSASPDDDSPEVHSSRTLGGSTVKRPRTLNLALSMMVISLVCQGFSLFYAIRMDNPTPRAVTGFENQVIPSELAEAAVWVLACGTGALIVVTVLTYLGFQWPRVILMAMLTVMLVAQLINGTVPSGGELTVHLLINLVNVVALLALSSISVHEWSRTGKPTWRSVADTMDA